MLYHIRWFIDWRRSEHFPKFINQMNLSMVQNCRDRYGHVTGYAHNFQNGPSEFPGHFEICVSYGITWPRIGSETSKWPKTQRKNIFLCSKWNLYAYPVTWPISVAVVLGPFAVHLVIDPRSYCFPVIFLFLIGHWFTRKNEFSRLICSNKLTDFISSVVCSRPYSISKRYNFKEDDRDLYLAKR